MRLSLFLIALTAFAQSPEQAAQTAEIEARFAAGTAPDLASAARLAADYKQWWFIPRLIPLIGHSDPNVKAAALDAIVDLKADVPQDIVERLIREDNDAGLIIAGLHPETHVSLLHLLDGTPNDKVWLTLNSIYFASTPPGYTARLLRQWTLGVTVVIADPGAPVSFDLSSPGIIACADSATPYPVRRNYRVQDARPARGIVLTLGPHPLDYGPADCDDIRRFSRDDYTLDFLRALGNFHELVPMPKIRNTSAAQYRRQAAAEAANVRTYVERLRRALKNLQKLPALDSTMPMLKVTVDDQRTNRSTPLPEVSWTLKQ